VHGDRLGGCCSVSRPASNSNCLYLRRIRHQMRAHREETFKMALGPHLDRVFAVVVVAARSTAQRQS